MGTGKLGLKLIGTHAIMSIVEFFLLIPLMGIWENNQLYQWFIGLLLIFIFWLVIYSDISYTSQNDLKRDRFWKPRGFFIGLVASIPAVTLFILTLLINNEPNFIEIALRFWLSPYSKVFISFQNQMPYLALVPIMLFPIISGLSYLDGTRKRKKILDAIKQSDSKRAEKSKVDK